MTLKFWARAGQEPVYTKPHSLTGLLELADRAAQAERGFKLELLDQVINMVDI